MIINHNIAAMNTHRQLTGNTIGASKSLEKLSSGLRINRAGDDAAGLAISEKMRAQIRGLDMASKNSQDGISLIQTAEGALNETHSILQRMRQLAVQSASDTNTASDRAKLQSEVDELAQEITRISNTTEFNTKNLLAGGLKSTFHIGANQGQNISVSIGALDAETLGVAASSIVTSLTPASGITSISNVTADLGTGAEVEIVAVNAAVTGAVIASQAGDTATTGAATSSGTYTGTSDVTFTYRVSTVGAGDEVTQIQVSTDGGVTWGAAIGNNGSAGAFDLGDGVVVTIASAAGNAAGQGGSVAATAANVELRLDNGAGAIGSSVIVRGNQSSVLLGDDSTGRTANVGFNFANLTATGTVAVSQSITASTSAVTDANGNVTTEAVVQKGVNISTQSAADSAITTINNALETVSSERSKLGAVQNRLEHTINNLGAASENLSAAEARIRDVDMAKEMMEFTKNNILTQAAQAMLAQANQQPQGVLQLLR